jgi:uncharacterized protein
MKIQIAGLSEGIHEYHFEPSREDLGLESRFADTIKVDATLDKAGTQMVFKARIQTSSKVECDRCVAPFSIDLSPSYTMYYVWNEAEKGRFDPSEVQVVPTGLPIIDITEDVRQVVLLAVPLKLVCREDCKGLCPRCGKNLNDSACSCTDSEMDPRWERLRDVRGLMSERE